jgi:hypothetical protein
MRFFSRGRRGSVTVLIGVSLTAMLAVLAMALDGGLTLEKRRSVQAATDAAAMAAAADLWDHYWANSGLDPNGTAAASARTTAAANGFNNDGTTNTVTVNINPLSGDFVGVPGYVEVIIRLNQPRGFSRIWGSATVPITGRAVAGGTPGNVAILMLEPHETVAAQIGDNVTILNNGQIYINSDATVYGEFNASHGNNAIYIESSGHLITGGINSVGPMGVELGGTVTYTGGGGLHTGLTPWPDPFLNVPEPNPLGAPNYGNVTPAANSTIQPGKYTKITIKTNFHVTMAPGIYFLTGGDIVMGVNSLLTGDGVMIYDLEDNALDVPVTAFINLTPPTAGPYRGISVFEPRGCGAKCEIHIKSDGNISMSGSLYSDAGEFDLRPGLQNTTYSFGAYVAMLAEWSPNSKLGATLGNIVLNPVTSAPTKRPLLVQ